MIRVSRYGIGKDDRGGRALTNIIAAQTLNGKERRQYREKLARTYFPGGGWR
jgi:hypothetical protein